MRLPRHQHPCHPHKHRCCVAAKRRVFAHCDIAHAATSQPPPSLRTIPPTPLPSLHGDVRATLYAWLRDPSRSQPSVLQHLHAEDAHAHASLRAMAGPALIERMEQEVDRALWQGALQLAALAEQPDPVQESVVAERRASGAAATSSGRGSSSGGKGVGSGAEGMLGLGTVKGRSAGAALPAAQAVQAAEAAEAAGLLVYGQYVYLMYSPAEVQLQPSPASGKAAAGREAGAGAGARQVKAASGADAGAGAGQGKAGAGQGTAGAGAEAGASTAGAGSATIPDGEEVTSASKVAGGASHSAHHCRVPLASWWSTMQQCAAYMNDKHRATEARPHEGDDDGGGDSFTVGGKPQSRAAGWASDAGRQGWLEGVDGRQGRLVGVDAVSAVPRAVWLTTLLRERGVVEVVVDEAARATALRLQQQLQQQSGQRQQQPQQQAGERQQQLQHQQKAQRAWQQQQRLSSTGASPAGEVGRKEGSAGGTAPPASKGAGATAPPVSSRLPVTADQTARQVALGTGSNRQEVLGGVAQYRYELHCILPSPCFSMVAFTEGLVPEGAEHDGAATLGYQGTRDGVSAFWQQLQQQRLSQQGGAQPTDAPGAPRKASGSGQRPTEGCSVEQTVPGDRPGQGRKAAREDDGDDARVRGASAGVGTGGTPSCDQRYGQYTLHVLNVATGRAVVPPQLGAHGPLVWSPDSSAVHFLASGGYQLWTLPLPWAPVLYPLPGAEEGQVFGPGSDREAGGSGDSEAPSVATSAQSPSHNGRDGGGDGAVLVFEDPEWLVLTFAWVGPYLTAQALGGNRVPAEVLMLATLGGDGSGLEDCGGNHGEAWQQRLGSQGPGHGGGLGGLAAAENGSSWAWDLEEPRSWQWVRVVPRSAGSQLHLHLLVGVGAGLLGQEEINSARKLPAEGQVAGQGSGTAGRDQSVRGREAGHRQGAQGDGVGEGAAGLGQGLAGRGWGRDDALLVNHSSCHWPGGQLLLLPLHDLAAGVLSTSSQDKAKGMADATTPVAFNRGKAGGAVGAERAPGAHDAAHVRAGSATLARQPLAVQYTAEDHALRALMGGSPLPFAPSRSARPPSDASLRPHASSPQSSAAAAAEAEADAVQAPTTPPSAQTLSSGTGTGFVGDTLPSHHSSEQPLVPPSQPLLPPLQPLLHVPLGCRMLQVHARQHGGRTLVLVVQEALYPEECEAVGAATSQALALKHTFSPRLPRESAGGSAQGAEGARQPWEEEGHELESDQSPPSPQLMHKGDEALGDGAGACGSGPGGSSAGAAPRVSGGARVLSLTVYELVQGTAGGQEARQQQHPHPQQQQQQQQQQRQQQQQGQRRPVNACQPSGGGTTYRLNALRGIRLDMPLPVMKLWPVRWWVADDDLGADTHDPAHPGASAVGGSARACDSQGLMCAVRVQYSAPGLASNAVEVELEQMEVVGADDEFTVGTEPSGAGLGGSWEGEVERGDKLVAADSSGSDGRSSSDGARAPQGGGCADHAVRIRGDSHTQAGPSDHEASGSTVAPDSGAAAWSAGAAAASFPLLEVPEDDSAGILHRLVWVPGQGGVLVPVTLVYSADVAPGGGAAGLVAEGGGWPALAGAAGSTGRVEQAGRLGLPVGAPVLLQVYGAFGLPDNLDYQPGRQPLLDRGWALALVHVRGSGHLGTAWHQAGRGRLKQQSAADLVAAAQALTTWGVASPGGICVEAASAGAWAAWAALCSHPHLFRASVLTVPSVDPLSAMVSHGYGWSELGCPLDMGIYRCAKGWNPADNLPKGAEPRELVGHSHPQALGIRPMEEPLLPHRPQPQTPDDQEAPFPQLLLRTGLADRRVAYWEVAGMAAGMRRSLGQQGAGGPPRVLLKVKPGDHDCFDTAGDDAELCAFVQAAAG